jgi:CcmD family protein
VKNLWYLFAAYSIICTALWLYTMRLSGKNKELQEELRDLQARVERVLIK